MLQTANRYELYQNAYDRLLEKYAANPQDMMGNLKKLIFYGVKAINSRPDIDLPYITREIAESDFQWIEILKDCMGLFTPAEFVTIFPITKEYDGEKYGVKDYFYTMNYIKTLNPEEPIGEKITDFLWEYHNHEISLFMVNLMGCMSKLRQLDGYPSIAQEWWDMNGIQTFTKHTDHKGKEYLIDGKTGKTMKIRPARHLKMVKPISKKKDKKRSSPNSHSLLTLKSIVAKERGECNSLGFMKWRIYLKTTQF